MLKRLRLSYKLGAMILLPVVCLAIFVGLDLLRRQADASEMTRLTALTELTMAAKEVENSLHVESNLTVDARGMAESAELRDQYEMTDSRLEVLKQRYAALDPDKIGDKLQTAMTAVDALENELPTRRKQLVGQPTIMIVSAYHSLAQQLIEIGTATLAEATDIAVFQRLQSLDLLAQIKAAANLERIGLNMVFSMDLVDQGMYQGVTVNSLRQDIYQSTFENLASPELLARYKEKIDSMSDEIASLRLDAQEKAQGAPIYVDASRWMEVSRARIDALSELEEEVVAEILATVESMRSRSRLEAVLGGFLAVLVLCGTVAISYLVGRRVNLSLTDASNTIRSAVSQITSSVQELTASTGETAAAVSETSTTVDELRQTSEAASKKAEATSAAADLSRGASERAQQSSVRGIEAMQAIRAEVEGIADRIVELSEKNAQISDIVQNVNAIAEQSNLLAVNASIEAAKAGEHGRGFAVVANEVKTLAERSKEATEQIRSILTEIQRSSNAAVMVTEQGVKRVDEGTSLIEELGEGIQTLAITIEESADSSTQISLISSQQLAGIEQITEAVRSVEQATSDNAAGAQQLEGAAKQLAEVCDRITSIVEGAAAQG
jgi:methyl-accepting chemotaxis protein